MRNVNKPEPITRHTLQVPGPTVVPDRVAQAMNRPMMDFRGPAFKEILIGINQDIKKIFKTTSPVLIYPASGTGAWHAAFVNTLASGDTVLLYETGMFSSLWKGVAESLGLNVIYLKGDWRHPIDIAAMEAALVEDKEHKIKAVLAVHSETSTGITSDIAALRKAIDTAAHPALFFADTISSLCATDYRHDEWGVDVAICGSQKGMMLPPGISFTAISDKAVHYGQQHANIPKGYFQWEPYIAAVDTAVVPYTPAIGLLFGLREVLDIIEEEGLDNIFARHAQLAAATRAALRHWRLELQCLDDSAHGNATTAVRMPDGKSADQFRALVLHNHDLSLAAGLGKIADIAFRIGHLGCQNAMSICSALCAVEMGLSQFDIDYTPGGVNAAMEILATPPEA